MYLKCSLHTEIFKIDFRLDTRVPSFKCKKHSNIFTRGLMIVYVLEKIHNLLSILSIHFVLFYDAGLNTQ